MREALTPRSMVYLSHVLSEATPGFGGAACFSRQVASAISRGKSSNSSIWTFNNHAGTHIDVPYHFSENGRTLTDYSAEEWYFQRPFLLDLIATPDQLIGSQAVFEEIPAQTDLLLLRTQFESRRGGAEYWQHNPGLLPEVATWLRSHRPFIRCIGFDFISLTAYQHREIGRETHRHFLCPEVGRPILVIEDMKLSAVQAVLESVIVSPCMVDGADGAPVCVFGFYSV